ncbi:MULTISPECIES: hypothetical protein [Dyadobacter]|uniref:Uncharacterized protein n=1 Tax=Dyadobacter psychrotolerans TaxID=2541721 RepID=A0A4R5DGT1_9BACT|nr:hypothetical protein [Dyadobacter psychrotolerans]TDE13216.1 hypothetical protein E0F88_19375 [Dyadobacter psychrotolerans]
MPSDATKSDVYKWMLIDKNDLKITPLEFLSMSAANLMEERFFRQGYLSFDSDQAVYIRESSSIQNILRIKDSDCITDSIVASIHEQLNMQRLRL